MKFRIAFFIIIATLLSACNFTLAEDVTPPPDYIPPTPMPTLGPLFPAQTPDVANGAAIYAEKCLPCHGETGLGDGPQGIQLGVTVKAFGLPEISRPASPEQYYTMVTRGNIERYMPPFVSLDDQQRWDVIAYVLSLHTTPEQVANGKKLFESNCANCATDFFKDQTKMSKLSEVDLARLARQGNDQVKPFGAKLSDDDLWAVAAYLRSISFTTTALAKPTVAPVAQTPVSAEATLVGTAQASAGSDATQVVQQPGLGVISGSVVNKTGGNLPTDLVLTLHGFDHSGTGTNTTAQEAMTQTGTVNADGTFTFNNVELPKDRIFLVDATYGGITLQSEYGVVKGSETAIALPPINLYSITDDTNSLTIDELHIFIAVTADPDYQITTLYNFHNSGKSVVAVKMGNQQEIPFLKFPNDAKALSYEVGQDSASFTNMDGGFAVAPNDKAYSILAVSSVTKTQETTITQQFVLPTKAVRIFVPDGLSLKGDNITAGSPVNSQGSMYQSYTAGNIKAGDTLTFILSGTAKATPSTTPTATSSNNTLLIGAGGLGLLLILAGVWMYWRDRKVTPETSADEEDEEPEFESSDEVMDAIIALDDLYRAKKISKDAYQKRRDELKDVLKKLM